MGEILRKIFGLPQFYDNSTEHQRALMLNIILWVSFLASFLLIIAGIVAQFSYSLLPPIIFIAVVSILIVMFRHGYLDWSSRLVPLLLLTVLSYNLFLGNGIHDVAVLLYPVVILFAGLLLGSRGAIYFGVASIISANLIISASENERVIVKTSPTFKPSAAFFRMVDMYCIPLPAQLQKNMVT